jgi:hypothetical protein
MLAWAGLAEETKTTCLGILERFRTEHGDKPMDRLERRHLRDLMAEKAATPSAANAKLMAFAIEEEWRKDDPTLGIKKIHIKS